MFDVWIFSGFDSTSKWKCFDRYEKKEKSATKHRFEFPIIFIGTFRFVSVHQNITSKTHKCIIGGQWMKMKYGIIDRSQPFRFIFLYFHECSRLCDFKQSFSLWTFAKHTKPNRFRIMTNVFLTASVVVLLLLLLVASLFTFDFLYFFTFHFIIYSKSEKKIVIWIYLIICLLCSH